MDILHDCVISPPPPPPPPPPPSPQDMSPHNSRVTHNSQFLLPEWHLLESYHQVRLPGSLSSHQCAWSNIVLALSHSAVSNYEQLTIDFTAPSIQNVDMYLDIFLLQVMCLSVRPLAVTSQCLLDTSRRELQYNAESKFPWRRESRGNIIVAAARRRS